MRCLGCVITGPFLITQSHRAGTITFSLSFCQLVQDGTAFGHDALGPKASGTSMHPFFLLSSFFLGRQLCVCTLFSLCCIAKHLCTHIFQTSFPFNTGSLVNPHTGFPRRSAPSFSQVPQGSTAVGLWTLQGPWHRDTDSHSPYWVYRDIHLLYCMLHLLQISDVFKIGK